MSLLASLSAMSERLNAAVAAAAEAAAAEAAAAASAEAAEAAKAAAQQQQQQQQQQRPATPTTVVTEAEAAAAANAGTPRATLARAAAKTARERRARQEEEKQKGLARLSGVPGDTEAEEPLLAEQQRYEDLTQRQQRLADRINKRFFVIIWGFFAATVLFHAAFLVFCILDFPSVFYFWPLALMIYAEYWGFFKLTAGYKFFWREFIQPQLDHQIIDKIGDAELQRKWEIYFNKTYGGSIAGRGPPLSDEEYLRIQREFVERRPDINDANLGDRIVVEFGSSLLNKVAGYEPEYPGDKRLTATSVEYADYQRRTFWAAIFGFILFFIRAIMILSGASGAPNDSPLSQATHFPTATTMAYGHSSCVRDDDVAATYNPLGFFHSTARYTVYDASERTSYATCEIPSERWAANNGLPTYGYAADDPNHLNPLPNAGFATNNPDDYPNPGVGISGGYSPTKRLDLTLINCPGTGTEPACFANASSAQPGLHLPDVALADCLAEGHNLGELGKRPCFSALSYLARATGQTQIPGYEHCSLETNGQPSDLMAATCPGMPGGWWENQKPTIGALTEEAAFNGVALGWPLLRRLLMALVSQVCIQDAVNRYNQVKRSQRRQRAVDAIREGLLAVGWSFAMITEQIHIIEGAGADEEDGSATSDEEEGKTHSKSE